MRAHRDTRVPVLTRQMYLLKAGKVDLNIVSTKKEVAIIMVIVIIIKTFESRFLSSQWSFEEFSKRRTVNKINIWTNYIWLKTLNFDPYLF